MKPFQQLLSVAMIGTYRSELPELPWPEDFAPLLPQLAKCDKEHGLLASGALLTSWQRAGYKPSVYAGVTPTPAEAETLPAVGNASARYLKRILESKGQDYLGEWLEIVVQAKKRIPFQLIPDLLDAMVREDSLVEMARPVLGQRGEWLMRQNPLWSVLLAQPSSWETGSKKERLACLRKLRAEDPAKGRECLLGTWKSEPAALRAECLRLFTVGLSLADEPFLEQALDDKSKEVRNEAADLLGTLAGSALVARMKARATTLVTMSPKRLLKRAALQVELPPDLDAAAIRDGLEMGQHMVQGKLGAKAGALLMILSSIPPSWWNEQLQQDPSALMKLSAGNEWSEAVQFGWARAALRHRDASWAEVILRGNFKHGKTPFEWGQLARVLSPEQRARLVMDLIREDIVSFTSNQVSMHYATEIMLAFDESWPDELANLVHQKLLPLMEKEDIDWQLQHLSREVIKLYSPRFCNAVLAAWPAQAEPTDGLRAWRDAIAFRAEIFNALEIDH
jgi:hypothetical protein